MPYKICPTCRSVSYSANSTGHPSCPGCQADLSIEPLHEHFPYEEREDPPKKPANVYSLWDNIKHWLKAQ